MSLGTIADLSLAHGLLYQKFHIRRNQPRQVKITQRTVPPREGTVMVGGLHSSTRSNFVDAKSSPACRFILSHERVELKGG